MPKKSKTSLDTMILFQSLELLEPKIPSLHSLDDEKNDEQEYHHRKYRPKIGQKRQT